MPSTKYISPQSIIATQRFALGARPGDLDAIANQPQKWLLQQLDAKPSLTFDTSLSSAIQVLFTHTQFRKDKKAFKKQSEQAKQNNNQMAEFGMQENNMAESNIMNPAMFEPNKQSMAEEKAPKSPSNGIYRQLCRDALQQSIQSEHSFNWRCLDFFSNHFSVSAQGSLMKGLAPTLEREAITPHLFGQFQDMLIAVCQHPAMLIYLNNEKSIGPSTRYAKKNRGLNENLAREIMELHTLGVNGGYQQKDVTELAKGLTGWSVGRPDKDEQQGFIYRYKRHEPGERKLLGKTYAEQGLGQGEEMLKDLANHPNTAKHVCTKIVRHFISDIPSPELVEHLSQTWLSNKGNLKKVFQALINHPMAWQPEQQKFKTPREYIISIYRALDVEKLPIKQAQNALTQLAQAPFKAGSPAGYSDLEEGWDGANALMSKINWVSQLAGRKVLRTVNINQIIDNTFANTLSINSYQMITRAESRKQALTLLLLSPEFLRR